MKINLTNIFFILLMISLVNCATGPLAPGTEANRPTTPTSSSGGANNSSDSSKKPTKTSEDSSSSGTTTSQNKNSIISQHLTFHGKVQSFNSDSFKSYVSVGKPQETRPALNLEIDSYPEWYVRNQQKEGGL